MLQYPSNKHKPGNGGCHYANQPQCTVKAVLCSQKLKGQGQDYFSQQSVHILLTLSAYIGATKRTYVHVDNARTLLFITIVIPTVLFISFNFFNTCNNCV